MFWRKKKVRISLGITPTMAVMCLLHASTAFLLVSRAFWSFFSVAVKEFNFMLLSWETT